MTRSKESILKEQSEVGGDLEEVQLDAISKSIDNLAAFQSVSRTFKRSEAKNGKCVYGYENTDMEKVEIYSQGGKDKIYLQTNLGPRGILMRAYASIGSVSPNEITVTGGAGVALAIPRYPYTSYSAGGNLAFVAKAKNVSVDAK